MKNLYRQGDVLIERVAVIPPTAKRKVTKGLVILAHGEVTGHHHSMPGAQVEVFEGTDGAEYFRVNGQRLVCELPVMRTFNDQVQIQHPKFGIIEFARSDVEVRNGMVSVNGDFALLVHQEHYAHGIPAGDYVGGVGGSVRQSEYSPEEIRNVQD